MLNTIKRKSLGGLGIVLETSTPTHDASVSKAMSQEMNPCQIDSLPRTPRSIPTPPSTPPPQPQRPTRTPTTPPLRPTHTALATTTPSVSAKPQVPVMATSLEPIQDNADFPPLVLLPEPAVAGASIVLYVFRVPGSADLCVSLAKPLRHVVTQIDIHLALYFVRVGADGTAVLLRKGHAVARLNSIRLEMLGAGYLKFAVVRRLIGIFCREEVEAN